MSQIEFFFSAFSLFLISVGSAVVGAYFPGYKMWVKYTNNCLDIFKVKKIPFIIKEYKYIYISWFVFFTLSNCFILSIFLWVWFNITIDIYQGKNILLFLPFVIVFLLSNILIFVLFKKYWNEIKKIGIYPKKEAIEEFKKFQLTTNFKTIRSFQITQYNQKSIQDVPFQFQQKRYRKKIKNLTKKNLNQEKYDIKLLSLFNNYLKIYAIFINRIKAEKYGVLINNSEKYDKLDYFPDIIINNFFAYAQQAQEELH